VPFKRVSIPLFRQWLRIILHDIVQLRPKRNSIHEGQLKPMGEISQEGRGANAKGKPRTELPIQDSELLAELNAGKSTRDLAKEYDVSPGTIRSRLREYDKEAYTRIACQRTSSKSDGQRKELPVSDSELHKQWKDRESIRALAQKYKVSRQTITRRLKEYNEQEYNETAKDKIAASIAERRKKIPITPKEVFDQLVKGESTATLAEKYHVSRQTISRILMKHDNDQYQKIVKERIANGRTKELLTPIDELKKRWENGESQENLEGLSGISYRQLLERLKRYDPTGYKEIAERRRRLKQGNSLPAHL
jgi:Mor family transcriptional regulator